MKARVELAADLAADLEACEIEYANVGSEEPVDPVRMVERERALRQGIDRALLERAALRALPCDGCGGDLDESGFCNVCGKQAA